MSLYYCLSFRFLDQRFHGRKDGDESEWPPSPLRAFQALVASAAYMGKGKLPVSLVESLEWLEHRSTDSPPIILASPGLPASIGYRLSVPNNAMDIVAKAWSKGNYSNKGDASPATHRTMKTVCPVHLLEGDAVHYLWFLSEPLDQEARGLADTLTQVARSVTALGWGIDMAIGDGAILTGEQVAVLPGERWLPSATTTDSGLRVPIPGTLKDLVIRHRGFMERLEGDKFTPPPPLSVFNKLNYRRAIDPPTRPVAGFSLLKLNASGFQPFNTTRKALTVAGMMRHAAKCAAERSGKSEIGAFILGHGESPGNSEHVSVGNRRFAYFPLPSIEARGNGQAPVVGDIRRVMLTVLDEGYEKEIAWARQALSGQVLEQEKTLDCIDGGKNEIALLSLLPNTDKVVQSYIRSSATWATVTPVVLPGYDDPSHYRRRLKQGTDAEEQRRLLNCLNKRIDGLIRKAIVQAGFSQVLADNAEVEWRKVGYWRGADMADRYGVPDHLKRFPRYHVKIQWRDEQQRPIGVAGPVCIGGGRFFGLGLFAPQNSSS